MKVALACPGMDHVRRGYEVSLRELFEQLKENPDYHLYKGTGTSKLRETSLFCLTRNAIGYRYLPFIRQYRHYQIECITFGLSLLPHLIKENYDLLYFADNLLGDFLLSIRKIIPFRTRLLFANGAPFPPEYCRRYDAIQQKVPVQYEKAITVGLDARRNFLVPNGFEDPKAKIQNDFDPQRFRRNRNWPEDKRIILSVAALNIFPKRLNWLIQEFSSLDPKEYFLVMAGQTEDETATLRTLARTKLAPGSYEFLSVAPDKIPHLLAAASIMILCSLDEGFGRAICEAMGAGCPILVHPHPGARSIVDQEECYVSMTEPGILAKRIQTLFANPAVMKNMTQKNLSRFHQTVSWNNVLPQYQKMFEAAANLPHLSS